MVILIIAGLWAKHAYEKHLMVEELREEGIYLFQGTTYFRADSRTIRAYYMVCEPVDDKTQLAEKLEQLMEEKDVVQKAKDYFQEDYGKMYGYEYIKRYKHEDLRISVYFYKPSKKYPIGWQPIEGYYISDYDEMNENLLMVINIPWNAETMDEHEYYFWEQNGTFRKTIHDTYKWQVQEDGSRTLVPEE